MTDLHGEVEQLPGHLLIGALQVAHQMPCEVLVLLRDERVRRTLGACGEDVTCASRVIALSQGCPLISCDFPGSSGNEP